MAKLAISLASRGRPIQLVQTIQTSVKNWTNPNTCLVVMLDDDDEASIQAVEDAKFDGKNVKYDIRTREDTIAAKWNRILGVDADVYSVAADDDPYITRGYDDSILQAATRFPDGVGMVYGHLANLSFTGSLSATRKWCEILGYLQPEHFPYWFCDHWTDDLARITGRMAFSDHRTDQSCAGATQEMREPAWWATFYDACYQVRRREAMKLLERCNHQTWEKDLRMLNAPLHEQRSFGVNQHVRQMRTTSGLKLDDPRYMRVKAKAVEMVTRELADLPQFQRDMFSSVLFPPQMPNLRQVGA
jgi:hypothetical protein